MKRVQYYRSLLLMALAMASLSPLSAVGEQRKIALVIGNGDYQDLGNLSNPPNDARDVASALSRIGFDVDLVIDGDLRAMEEAVVRLGDRISVAGDAIGLFYFAGHGVQSDGANYLIPARASIPAEDFLGERSVSSQTILGIMQRAENDLNIVVLDACRDNPFSWSRSGASRGLSPVAAQPPGSIVVYATSAGSVAADGTGRNGVFTEEFLRHISVPGLDIKEVFNRTGMGVMNATGGKQVPAVYSQFFEAAFLAGQGPGDDQSPPGLITSSSVPLRPKTDRMSRNTVYVLGGAFEMGSSERLLGNEKPLHTVSVGAFYMMTTEVTFDQFDRFALETGRELPNDEGWGRGDRPVINVSWYDAVAYANWMSEQDGLNPVYEINGRFVAWDREARGWRLPTEAEWEFAARGGRDGSNTVFAGSSDAASVAWYRPNSRSRPQPVGTKQANELGLHDMTGNVWEWCWDWFESDYYAHSPSGDPPGPATGVRRVLRGGTSH